jgi:hypothetical protein
MNEGDVINIKVRVAKGIDGGNCKGCLFHITEIEFTHNMPAKPEAEACGLENNDLDCNGYIFKELTCDTCGWYERGCLARSLIPNCTNWKPKEVNEDVKGI